MKTVEKAGRTIDEAIDAAIEELGSSRREVNIEIINMPAKGFLGIGSKDALVRVSVEDGATTYAVDFLTGIFKQFGLNVEIHPVDHEEYVTLDLVGRDLGILIGRRGETLDALQYLTNLTVARHFSERTRFVIDVEGYRGKREDTLKRLALRLADKVKETGRNTSLEPMSPYERRIIHTVLQDDEEVRTFSEGEEPYRKVVIARKK